MELFYIANARIPTEKAHGLHIAKMCEAFGNAGAKVTLVLPKRHNDIVEDIFSYYNIEKNFAVRYIPVMDLVGKGFIGYWLTQFFFSWKLFWEPFNKNKSFVITRDELSGFILRLKNIFVYYDMHGFPETWVLLWRIAMKKMNGIICTNEWKMKRVHEQFNVPMNKMILARNAFDPSIFSIDMEKNEIREELGLPVDKTLAVYAGHLYDWKGAGVLAKAANYLDDVEVIFIGGTKKDVKDFSEKYSAARNITMLGHKKHDEVPKYLKAADILVLPNSKESKNPRAIPYSIFDTSPIKLFEYMASGSPIVASDLPSIREILNNETAVFFEPDNPKDLARSIKNIVSNKEEAKRRTQLALETSQQFTWKKRAEKILSFMNYFQV